MRIFFQKIYQCKKSRFCLIVSAVLISFFIGLSFGSHLQHTKFEKFIKTFKNVRDSGSNFTFISPLIGSLSSSATEVGIFSELKEELVEYLDNEKKKDNLSDYSFYFKDLNSPLWFGINEDNGFFPASLFKLPIAIAVYKQAETDPSFLTRRFVYTKEIMEINKSSTSNEDTTLVVGNSYSIEELIMMMLELSDNGAKDLLVEVMDKRYVSHLFKSMDLIDPLSVNEYQISSRKYAFFLRLLYNSSYLNEEHSERILNLLSKSAFKNGIVAGVPAIIPTAHKFGVFYDNEGQKMLHDCGIVYVPEDPYVICIMTKGKDTETLLRIISDISKTVYEKEND